MFEQLIHFDQHLFRIINHDWANPFFDSVMPWVCTPANWIPLYVFIIVFCLWKFKKTRHYYHRIYSVISRVF